MKKLLILILIIILTGCDINYDLVITDKGEVKEKFYIYIDNETIKNNSMSNDEYLDYYSNLYMNLDNYKNFKIKTKEGKTESYFIVTNNYNNLNDYIESYSFKNMFNRAILEQVGKYTSFQTTSNTFLQSIKNDELLSEENIKNKYIINIKFYTEVVNHNADKVDLKNNIYTWYVDSNTTKDNIYFKYGSKKRYDVIIKDIIERNLFVFITILSIVVILLTSIIYILIKGKKNNEI